MTTAGVSFRHPASCSLWLQRAGDGGSQDAEALSKMLAEARAGQLKDLPVLLIRVSDYIVEFGARGRQKNRTLTFFLFINILQLIERGWEMTTN